MVESKLDKFKILLEKNPDSPLAHYSLANEYYKQKMYQEAIKHILSYLELKDDEGAVYRMLAECYIELDLKEDAVNSYKKGIEAALKYGHDGMAEEFEDSISYID